MAIHEGPRRRVYEFDERCILFSLTLNNFKRRQGEGRGRGGGSAGRYILFRFYSAII